jgi:thymidylate synthase (FAD)
MVEFKFHVKLPIFVARQWIRHRTANVNEYSGRYSIMREEFYRPRAEDIRYQSEVNKQGRSDEEVPEGLKADFMEHLEETQDTLYAAYEAFCDQGLARELARINLPLSLYTEWYWKIDLHNLFHFLKLRLDPAAQKEIREYALVMAQMVRTVCPVAYEAFEDFQLQAVSFSAPELRIVGEHLSAVETDTEALAARGLSKREAREFKGKLRKIKKLLGG